MSSDVGFGLGFVAALAVLSLALGLIIPAQFTAVNADTSLSLDQSQSETEKVFRTINSTIDDVSAGETTITLTDTQTLDSETVTLNESETVGIQLDDTVTVTAESIDNSAGTVEIRYQFSNTYGLTESVVTILNVFQSLIISVIIFFIFGGIAIAVGLI